MKIAVVCAFPHEWKAILKHLKLQRRSQVGGFRVAHATHLSHEILLVVTGMGTRNAEEALEWILQVFNPALVLSIGFGGALYEDAGIGDLIMATSVSLVSGRILKTIQIPDASELVDRLFGKTSIRAGHFLTLDRWMDKETVKRLLLPEIAFPVCDMETFPLAELTRQRQLPFLAVRSITDRADEEIPRALLKVNDALGSYRFLRAIFLLLSKPWLIPVAMRLGRRSRVASENLWRAIETLARIL
jgi:adenosylhomocysteine nucleosidase